MTDQEIRDRLAEAAMRRREEASRYQRNVQTALVAWALLVVAAAAEIVWAIMEATR